MKKGWIDDILNLILEIEKQCKFNAANEIEFDFLSKKEKFFMIEEKVKTIRNFQSMFENQIECKLKTIRENEKDKRMRFITAYLNMVFLLSHTKDSMVQAGVICLMIPVMCQLMREAL